MRISVKTMLIVSAIAMTPMPVLADMIELSQGQLRQLVQQRQVLGSEAVSASATSEFGGEVVDIRAFLSDGRMTYRLLLQRVDGAVVELLFNGTDGARISHSSQIGQEVSLEARSNNGRSNVGANDNPGASGNNSRNGNSGGNGNAGNNSRSSDRGNGGDRGNSSRGGGQNGRGN